MIYRGLDTFFITKISFEEFHNIFVKTDALYSNFTFNTEKKSYHLKKSLVIDTEIILHPPLLHIISIDDENLNLSSTLPNFLILLIRSGSVALGISKNGKIIEHKRITKYMVRKKQGKSQITYFSLKGKSSGGGKLRLQQTREFFDEINRKLEHWSKKIKELDLILYQASPRIWGYLFKPNNKIPFDKKDKNIFKIPYTVNKPTHKEIEKINRVLTKGIISTNKEMYLPEIIELLE